ncbi:MAG: histidine kinase [Mycobacterium sp.]
MSSSTAPAPIAADHAATPSSGAADLTRSLTRQALLVAGVCLFADAVQFLFSAPVSVLRPQDWGVFVAIALADAALALPARFSGWVAAAHAIVQLVAAVLTAGTVAAHGVGSAGFLIAGYRAGAWLSGTAARVALAVLVFSAVGASLIYGDPGQDPMVVDVASNALLPWLVGRYTTARRGYIAELERQAEAQRRDARAAVDQAVREERSSIARDLHDVISHHVSAIGVHAGAARMRLTAATDPPGVQESLSAVELSSRAAMSDLRRLLDVLHGESTGSDQVRLENIEDLLNGARRAGLATRFTSEGGARPVPDSVQLALYRITQELLTNAARYGDGGTVDICLRYRDSAVSVTASNTIGPVADSAFGNPDEPRPRSRGLAGIRERAALFGGTVAYGPGPDGLRWETVVVLPLAES